MAKRGENIYLRKDGRYEGRYIKGRRADGKAVFGSVYARRYADVKRRLVEIKSALYGAQAPLKAFGDGTLEAWGAFYLKQQVKGRVKEGTYANYRRNLEKHIAPLLGQVALSKLTPEQIQGACQALQARLKAGTVRGVMRMLRAMLAAAVESGLLRESPYRAIRLPKGGTPAPRVLTRGEQKRLEGALRREGGLEYLLCLYTGLRVGEVCGLRWQDVDLENQLLSVRGAIKRAGAGRGGRKTKLILGEPKSESSRREIPLPAFLAAMLRSYREGATGEGDFVFRGRKGGMRDTRTLQKKLGRVCQGLGLEGVHMHTLRHSFSTRCLEQGMGVEVLSALLGHSSPQVTLKYYAHCTEESKRKGMALLERMA